MWLKLLLLTLYLLFLFVLCRMLEAVSWYHDTGTLLTSFVVLDPIALSVRKLKELLDNRGISYSGVVEKHELVELVRSSGQATKEELVDAMFPSKVPTESTQFTCGSHFYEEVEDTKDSAWLVQVVVDDNSPPVLPERKWMDISFKAGNFGIRSGIFKCSLDRRLCKRKGWDSSRLILSLPRGHKAKEDVILHNHLLPSSSASIQQWVKKHLASRVWEIKTEQELEQWLSYSDNSKNSEIRVILFSFLKSCPMFLSALAIKFNGRVKFGTVDANTIKSYKKFANLEEHPSYLVVTPEKTFSYGSRRGECYNMKSMELYLKTFVPEMNDVFLWSLLLVNILAAFEFFYMYSSFWKHFFLYAVCVVKYNCVLFLFWLLVLALYQFPVMMTFTNMSLKCLRIISESSVASIFRNDYKSFYSNTFLLFTFVSFASISGYLLRKFKWLQPDQDTIFSSFRPLSRSTRVLSLQELDMEIDMEFLIERLAVPNLWLQPVISMDYVKNLPMWKYNGWCEADDELEERREEALFSSDDENLCKMPLVSTNLAPVPGVQPSPFSGISLCESAANTVASSQSICIKTPPIDNSKQLQCSSPELSASDIGKTVPSLKPNANRAPKGMLEFRECSICLENYRYEECLCGLPCGHNFHMNCIMVWLTGDNHCCPICRWPSYKFKHGTHHLHSQ